VIHDFRRQEFVRKSGEWKFPDEARGKAAIDEIGGTLSGDKFSAPGSPNLTNPWIR